MSSSLDPAQDLQRRIRDLSQRWLPMLLSRAGVSKASTMGLRGQLDGGALRHQLAKARAATLAVSREEAGENGDVSSYALEVIAQIERALDLSERDLARAERLFERVNHGLMGLLVGKSPDPQPVSMQPPSWLSRLLARTVTAGGALH